MPFVIPAWVPYKGGDLEPLMYRFRARYQLKKTLLDIIPYSSTNIFAAANKHGDLIMTLGKKVTPTSGKLIYADEIVPNRKLSDRYNNECRRIFNEVTGGLEPEILLEASISRVATRLEGAFQSKIPHYLVNLFGADLPEFYDPEPVRITSTFGVRSKRVYSCAVIVDSPDKVEMVTPLEKRLEVKPSEHAGYPEPTPVEYLDHISP